METPLSQIAKRMELWPRGRSVAFTSLMTNPASILDVRAILAPAGLCRRKIEVQLAIRRSPGAAGAPRLHADIQQAFGDVSDAMVDVQKYRAVGVQHELYVKDLDESLRLSEMRNVPDLTSNSRWHRRAAMSSNQWSSYTGP
jgi:hypothetical protein